MIPDIDEILSMLVTGRCTQAEASAWFNTHMELAAERDDGLRDHFAGLALQGMLACPTNFLVEGGKAADGAKDYAMLAFMYADEMIKARGGAT